MTKLFAASNTSFIARLFDTLFSQEMLESITLIFNSIIILHFAAKIPMFINYSYKGTKIGNFRESSDVITNSGKAWFCVFSTFETYRLRISK